MKSLVGKKFYLSEPYIDFPYPEDIRILEENDEEVLIKQGSRKIIIDKETLHKYYTMITPKIVFAIRFLTNADLRDSLLITVNTYKPETEPYGYIIYFQKMDLLKLYMEYTLDHKFAQHRYESEASIDEIDDEHVVKLPVDTIPANSYNFYREKRYIVYGYQEDELKDLIKFIPRKKWLNTIKYAFNCINSIYDYGIDTNTKSLLRFFDALQKDYTTSIETCNLLDILPDTYLKKSKEYEVIQILLNLRLSGNKPIESFTDQEVELLSALIKFRYGLRRGFHHPDIIKIDLPTIKFRDYKDTDNIEDMKSNNPDTIYRLVKLKSLNKIYLVSFKEKPIKQQILSGENKALSDDEINKFMKKKTVS